MAQKRLEWIDMIRGIAIMLVVFGHCITKKMAADSYFLNILRTFIYMIHMPVFFALSGWLFEKNINKYMKHNFILYFVSKFKLFMIPYIVFSIINYILILITINSPIAGILISEGYHSVNIIGFVFSVITYIGHQDAHLWFCYVMFIVLCINRLFIRNIDIRTAVFLIIIYFVSCFAALELPEIVFKSMKYLLLFCVGRYMYKNNISEKNHSFVFLLTLVSFFLYMLFDSYNIKTLSYIFRLMVELSIMPFIFQKCFKAKHNDGFIAKIFKYIGLNSHSYGIYLIHMPFMTSAIVYILQKINIPVGVVIIISSLISITMSLLVYKIITKSKIISKYCFGKC